jgi:hypothetical protein
LPCTKSQRAVRPSITLFRLRSAMALLLLPTFIGWRVGGVPSMASRADIHELRAGPTALLAQHDSQSRQWIWACPSLLVASRIRPFSSWSKSVSFWSRSVRGARSLLG